MFNGQRYTIGLPVTTSVDLSTYSFGYEYDFLYFSRGFVGASVNLKYTNVDVDLQSPIGAEFFDQAAPIPAFGFAGRGYLRRTSRSISSYRFFRIPNSLSGAAGRRRQLHRLRSPRHLQLHNNVGAQLGWRRRRSSTPPNATAAT